MEIVNKKKCFFKYTLSDRLDSRDTTVKGNNFFFPIHTHTIQIHQIFVAKKNQYLLFISESSKSENYNEKRVADETHGRSTLQR